MEERWIFYIFCSFLCVPFVEIEADDSAFNLESLMKDAANRYENSLRLKNFDPLSSFGFDSFNEDFDIQPFVLRQNQSKCSQDIMYTLQSIKSKSDWALRLIDSIGKPQSGILEGNIKWIGNYDQCLAVRAFNPLSSTVGNFRGKYCTLSFSINNISLGLPSIFGFSAGICVPDSCSAKELQGENLPMSNLEGPVPFSNDSKSPFSINSIECKPIERHLNAPAKAVIALLSIFLALSILGSSITAVKYFKKTIDDFGSMSYDVNFPSSSRIDEKAHVTLNGFQPNEKSPTSEEDESHTSENVWLQRIGSFFCCFCMFTNGAKLLNTDVSEGELLCIHGIRVLSMAWVILGHTYLWAIQQIQNIAGIKSIVDDIFFQIILQGFYSVDSFFVLSGFLLTYLTMRELNKRNGSLPWVTFYIHRYIRLTPIYMLILAFSATIYLYLGAGPFWPVGDIDATCQKGWWKNLIYINNFADQSDQCMGWGWYLANDMQFFVISPIFLITLWRWPKIGYSLVAIFMLACWSANFYITYEFGLFAGLANISQSSANSLTKFTDYFNKIYIKPYTRIAPYLLGILTGYFLFKRKHSGDPQHNLIFMAVGWLVSTVITLYCVFGLYHSEPPPIGNCFYNALNRTGFGLGVSWVIYACLVGQGGFVNSFLSWKVFIPLSRLTYAAYLIHPLVIQGYFNSVKMSFEFSHLTMVMLFFAFLITTYLLALPTALILESPVVTLEKLARRGFAKQQKKTSTVN